MSTWAALQHPLCGQPEARDYSPTRQPTHDGATTNDCVRRQHGQSWECRPQARLFPQNGLAARLFVRGPEPNKPCQPSGTHPCAAGHGSSGARGCSGSPPRQHLPARRSALAPGVRRSARYTKAGRNEQGPNLCEPAAPAAVRGPTHPQGITPAVARGPANAPVTQPQPGAAGGSTTPRKR